MNNTFLGNFLTQLVKLISPLLSSFSDEAKFKELLLELGWNVNNFPSAQFNSIVAKHNELMTAFQNLGTNPTDESVIAVINKVGELYNVIISNASSIGNNLDGLGNSVNEFVNEFPKRLFDLLIITHLNQQFPEIYNNLEFFNVIERNYIAETADRPAFVQRIIRYDKFPEIVNNPLAVVKEKVSWGENLIFDNIQRILADIFSDIKIPVTIKDYLPTAYNYDFLFSIQDNNNSIVTVYPPSIPDVGFIFRIIDSIDSDSIENSGFIIEAEIPLNIPLSQDFSNGISYSINTSLAIGKTLAFLVKPSILDFAVANSEDSSFPSNSFELLMKYHPEKPGLVFGKPEGTRFQINNIGIGVEVNYGGEIEFILNADLSGLALIIDPTGSDNFINNILGGKAKEINFPLTISWSSKNGISFKGSGSFEYKINTHFKIGPIEFNNVTVAVTAPQGQNDVKVAVGTDIKGSLGPVSFTVNNIGLSLVLGLIEGNAGPFDIQIGFKSPTGVGLAIDAPPVSGGGFLNYDEATYTYTGGLELNFSKISFSAIGIISTKLPGGEDGYSLLIIITAEFGPLPIGMGFTLNGLGGLMGLNRTMNPEFLREGIKNNTLDSILFPKDIVKNANTIISNIGQAFPILKDQFVIGPMAKIGWGTPTLITIELGIMIELPNPVRLAILGVLKAILPTEDKAILKIQVNFLGIIDFDNKYISFDASLYDSKILTFGLFGDMALRLYWGDEPNFLLSIGGFHPKFTPPPLDLPTMRRLSIVLANESNLKISVETYFAVTSNSVQFGAKVAAMAKAWKIQAIGALWFDILFQFSPFHFIADMGAMFAIKMGSKTILSLFIDLSLEGPHPWKAQGRGSFKILFVKVNVSFNKTFGSANVATIPPVAIDDKFTDALKSKDNWEAILADRNNQQVACREIAGYQQDMLIVDPGGSLRFSQNLVPLDTKIEKFGNSAISDYNQYSISAANHGFTLSAAQDYFARNSFFYLSDDDKLSRPSYELFNSGIIAGATAIVSRFAVHRLCKYEQITLDSGYRELKPVWAMLESVFDVHVFENYVSRAQIAQFDKIPTEKGWPGTVQLSHDDDDFVLVNRNNLEQAIPQSFSSSVEAERVLQENRNTQPGVASEWIVANRFELEL